MIGKILQVQRDFKGALRIFFTVGNSEIGAEVSILLLAERFTFYKNGSSKLLGCLEINGR